MPRTKILLAASAVAAAALLALAASAQAHVTVSAPGATRGGSDQEITFRVPVEKDSATVGLTVELPTQTPIASVLVEPVTGWSHTQQTVTLAKPIVTDDGDITTAVSQIAWTASAGHGLSPGEFGAFTIIAGQLPDTGSLTFRALQRYADGSVVAWNEVAAPGSTDEPDNPAPVLELAADGATASTASMASTASTASTGGGSSDTTPVVLSIVALVVAVAALGLAVLRGRRPVTTTASTAAITPAQE